MNKKLNSQQIENIKQTLEINFDLFIAWKIMNGKNTQSFFTRTEIEDAYKEGFACGIQALLLNQ